MPREYRHIKMYEKEIFELREQGLSQRQIAEKLGFPYEKMHDFFRRHNRNQRKLAAGIAIKPKGRPRKDGAELPPSVQQLSKLMQLQYELAGKERKNLWLPQSAYMASKTRYLSKSKNSTPSHAKI